MKKVTLLFAILFSISFSPTVNAQVYIQLSLNEYLEKVRKGNVDYAAERLNIKISDAEIISASVYANPVFSFGYYNNELKNMQMGHGGVAEISRTFSPGRRDAAIKLAYSQKELSVAVLADFFRLLREEATVTWLETVKMREIYEIRRNSYRDQIKMMESDSLNRGHDYNRDLDIKQNKVETGILFGDIIDTENELNAHYLQLTAFCGVVGIDTIYIPERRNIWNNKEFVLKNIVDIAVENRADILAAKSEIRVADRIINSAKKERIPEFDLFFAYGINSEVRNELAPAPKHGGFEVGISIPIPLFNQTKGAIISAQTEKSQAELKYISAKMKVKNEVVNAYNSFVSADKKMKLFTGGLIRSAREVLDQKREEYYNGEIHLIEVLDAQRSYDNLLLSFYGAIYDKSQALVRLESAMGVWNIE